jgi:hypothetical protein
MNSNQLAYKLMFLTFSGACLSIYNPKSVMVDAESQASTAFPLPIATRIGGG